MSIAYDWSQAPGDPQTSDRAECALLGVLLLVGAEGLKACERLRADDFATPARAAVLTTMRKLAFVGTTIDVITVVDELEKKLVMHPWLPGGTAVPWWKAISDLLGPATVGAADDGSIRAYARIVAGAAALRRNAMWVA
ncbi:MAG: DnaB-like helicase N-terminal domain-containing protein [Elusimicrobiota bacterium]|jgi:replicative DNA helicase